MTAGLGEFVETTYGLQGFENRKLAGYANKNYRITRGRDIYLLKTYEDQSLFDVLLGENLLLHHLYSNGINVPTAVKGVDGQEIYQHNGIIVRLLTYLTGKFWGDIQPTERQCLLLGRTLANLDKKLIDYRNSGIESKRLTWDLANFEAAFQSIDHISNPSRKKLVLHFHSQFKSNVEPIWAELPKQIIHNDANEWNILLQENQIGLIDFGDSVYTARVCEIAIAMTYVIMKTRTLNEALVVLKGYSEGVEISEEEIDALYYLIGGRLCLSVLHSAYSIKQDPDNEYLLISEEPAWKMLEYWLTVNPRYATQLFYEAAGKKKAIPEAKYLLSKRQSHLSNSLSTSYSNPIYMDSAAFQYMYDKQGNTYLDAYNNIPHVGHQHPVVTEAAVRQLKRLNTNTRYLYDELTDYAEKLLSRFPDQLCKVFFVNSGSAATDLALRLANVATGRKEIAVMEHGYHGNSAAGISVSHYKYAHKGGDGKQDHILELPLPDFIRGEFLNKSEDEYIESVLNVLQTPEVSPGAFIAEPIIGCGGQIPLPKGLLNSVYQVIREKGGVCISDEVQVGFGRMGRAFWGYELYNVIPDIVILGKPMGNGHPIGAVVTTAAIADAFDNGMEFFSSFGGNPVSCAIGLAVLEVIEQEELQRNALRSGDYFKGMLKELGSEFATIADVRGEGLFLGVEILNPEGQPGTKAASQVKDQLRDNCILVSTDGPYDNVIKMKPPLCFNSENAEQVVEKMRELLIDLF